MHNLRLCRKTCVWVFSLIGNSVRRKLQEAAENMDLHLKGLRTTLI